RIEVPGTPATATDAVGGFRQREGKQVVTSSTAKTIEEYQAENAAMKEELEMLKKAKGVDRDWSNMTVGLIVEKKMKKVVKMLGDELGGDFRKQIVDEVI
ncbi:hypothetical protein L195_g031142, partial [Trifolium pratense]